MRLFIRMIKKLKWREIITFKSIWGGLRDENNKSLNPSLLKLPTTANGQPITFAPGSTPYIEGSIGVENIFKFVRVDLVRRFTYLNDPEVAEWGVRARVIFNF